MTGRQQRDVNVKLKQLLMTCKQTDSVLDSNKDTAIKRQLEALTNEVETLRRGIEGLKIDQKLNKDEVAMWNSQVETELEKADDNVKHTEKWQVDCKLEKERNAFEKKLKYKIKLHETKTRVQTSSDVGKWKFVRSLISERTSWRQCQW
ncbi:Hypothetical predicted protein [Paramuricea clavata]|uniref:Uncharacterized protein n=1 Tax=Paramuricea clavata TaxID=317549 RepID=A0A7D9DNQ9_PARCT|nr:Hypothetical predicted protein [Paramuricea clavata]